MKQKKRIFHFYFFVSFYNLKNTLKTFLHYMIKEAKENYYKYNDSVLTKTKKKNSLITLISLT